MMDGVQELFWYLFHFLRYIILSICLYPNFWPDSFCANTRGYEIATWGSWKWISWLVEFDCCVFLPSLQKEGNYILFGMKLCSLQFFSFIVGKNFDEIFCLSCESNLFLVNWLAMNSLGCGSSVDCVVLSQQSLHRTSVWLNLLGHIIFSEWFPEKEPIFLINSKIWVPPAEGNFKKHVWKNVLKNVLWWRVLLGDGWGGFD